MAKDKKILKGPGNEENKKVFPRYSFGYARHVKNKKSEFGGCLFS